MTISLSWFMSRVSIAKVGEVQSSRPPTAVKSIFWSTPKGSASAFSIVRGDGMRYALLLGVYFPRLAGVPESPDTPPPEGTRLPNAALGLLCLASSSYDQPISFLTNYRIRRVLCTTSCAKSSNPSKSISKTQVTEISAKTTEPTVSSPCPRPFLPC